MDNIIEVVKDKVDDLVEKIKGDDGLLSKFKESPMDTVKGLLGNIDLPDGALENIVSGIKAKLGSGSDFLGGLWDKAKDLFDKDKD